MFSNGDRWLVYLDCCLILVALSFVFRMASWRWQCHDLADIASQVCWDPLLGTRITAELRTLLHFSFVTASIVRARESAPFYDQNNR
ncbi:hypothetical protein F5Y14DRAFT_202414 [Nemania sp. NC0429]|nr:hypothetical protein F5Y14DRAFT_202414 [Nemania sp. NC0429]